MGNKNNEEIAVLLRHKDGKVLEYPADHKFGMAVDVPGSSCKNCEYLRRPGICGNEFFIKWNGSEKIPAKNMNAYCCDEWHSNKEKK